VIGLFTFISILYFAQTIIIPIIYSIIIAIVLSPMVDFFVRKKMNRALAISTTLLLVICILIAIIALLSSQLMQFSDSFPKLLDKLSQLLDRSTSWISEYFNISTRNINLLIAEKKAAILNESSSRIGQTLINTGNVLVVLLLIPVYIFMILYYQPLLLEFIHKLFKSINQQEVSEVLTETKTIVRSYLVGLLLEAAIVAILNSISLLILGIEYAILLGVMGAILNLIPYLGGIVAAGLSMLITLATTSSFSCCLMVLAAYIIVQLIDNNYIIPKVVASKVKINALASIIVVLAGGALWGISGMFLSIPLIAIIKVIFDRVEPLKPWGYLLGDTMPPLLAIKLPFSNKLTIKQIKNTK
jgi:predicted PurR-regulated permease PerM